MNANDGWIMPFIVVGGWLQSCGGHEWAAQQARRKPVACFGHSFTLITFFFAWASLILPHPFPTQKDW